MTFGNIDGSRDLSDSWTGFTQFTILSEKLPRLMKWHVFFYGWISFCSLSFSFCFDSFWESESQDRHLEQVFPDDGMHLSRRPCIFLSENEYLQEGAWHVLF